MEIVSQVCRVCKTEKPIEEFSKHKRYKSGRMTYCKECVREEARRIYHSSRASDPEFGKKRAASTAASHKKLMETDPERRRRYCREYRKRRPEIHRNEDLKSAYGITLSRYAELSESQNNKCAICGQTSDSMRFKKLAVDHCHTTNTVRGLLCDHCNRGLGCFRDDTTLLEQAIQYLANSKGEHI